MPSFSDSIFLFILALLLFGPKKLPVLAREIGKWVGEFRKASNEFKMQMEEELRVTEQADRQRQIAAMEAAAPPTAALPESGNPEPAADAPAVVGPATSVVPPPVVTTAIAEPPQSMDGMKSIYVADSPLPIAVEGEMKIMPPATGLPQPRKSALSGLLGSIPEAKAADAEASTEAVLHGD